MILKKIENNNLTQVQNKSRYHNNMAEQFKTNVSIKLSCGTYSFCGNNYNDERSGYYLSTKGEEKIMISIDIEINDVLFKQIDYIEVHNENGTLAQYMRDTLRKRSHSFFFGLSEEKKGDNYKICYQKIQPQTDENRLRLRRVPMKTIHYDIIKIPSTNFYNSDCAICLETVNDDRYISICQHIFHSGCIIDYAKQNNFVKPLDDHCKRFCLDHSEKILPFPCPICKCILEDNKNNL